MGKPLQITVDFDDTICYFQQHVLNRVNSELGTSVELSDITSWGLDGCLTEDVVTAMTQIYEGGANYSEVLPNESAINALHALHNDGHNITIVTAGFGKSDIVKQKIEWLEKYLPFISLKDIAFLGNKGITFGDIIIDDGWHNLVDARYGRKILIPYEWNRKEYLKYLTEFGTVGCDIIRTGDWKTIYEICDKTSTFKN